MGEVTCRNWLHFQLSRHRPLFQRVHSSGYAATSYIMVKEANLSFYKGILCLMCKEVRHKIPDAHQMATLAPSITSMLSFLRDTFDVDHIDNTQLDLYSDTDLDLSDNNHDLEPPIKCPHLLKKVQSGAEHIPEDAMIKPQ